MIELAEALLEGREDPVAADRELGGFMVAPMDLGSGSSPAISARASYSGMAAISVLLTALHGDYGDDDLSETTDDENLDPEEWETEYHASHAAGCGLWTDHRCGRGRGGTRREASRRRGARAARHGSGSSATGGLGAAWCGRDG